MEVNMLECNCLYCGATFEARRDSAKWCSARCRQAAYRYRQAAQDGIEPVPAIRRCEHCHKLFRPQIRTQKARFCNPRCRALYAHYKARGERVAIQRAMLMTDQQYADFRERTKRGVRWMWLERLGFRYSSVTRQWEKSV